MTLPYGISPAGERVVGTRPVSQGRRTSAIGASPAEGTEACMTFEGTLDGEMFLFCLTGFLCRQVVITDNAEGVKQLIQNTGAKLICLPPCSPNLSPTELRRSKVRQFLKKTEARTKEALNEAVSKALNIITENDCKGRFEHCGYIV